MATVPTFFNVPVQGAASVGYSAGSAFCKSQQLRLCSDVDVDSVCTDSVTGSNQVFPMENSFNLTAGKCTISSTKAQLNAGQATLMCCSTAPVERALIGNASEPVLTTSALSASSFLNNRKANGYGYNGMEVLRSGSASSAWCAASTSSATEWVQVNFPRPSMVVRARIYPGTSVEGTTGRLNSFYFEFRRTSTAAFERVKLKSASQAHLFTVFRGVGSADFVDVTIPNVKALQIRLVPVSWTGSSCMRLELFGPALGKVVLSLRIAPARTAANHILIWMFI